MKFHFWRGGYRGRGIWGMRRIFGNTCNHERFVYNASAFSMNHKKRKTSQVCGSKNTSISIDDLARDIRIELRSIIPNSATAAENRKLSDVSSRSRIFPFTGISTLVLVCPSGCLYLSLTVISSLERSTLTLAVALDSPRFD